jgi:hypothetical protein
MDFVLAGFCWWRPLDPQARPLSGWRVYLSHAAAWGLLGGLCALANPIIGFAWGTLSVLIAGRAEQRNAWSRLAVAIACAGLTVSPWVIRNYLVFGRLVPIKSNAAYEFYQSQCLQADGLLQRSTFQLHPHMVANRERSVYKELGEMAFMDQKWESVRQSVAADPLGFLKRVTDRFLGAAVWYTPFDRTEEMGHWSVLWFHRVIHVLPLAGLLAFLYLPAREPVQRAQWIVIGIYIFYLSPYIIISYYAPYGQLLLGVKALLMIWGVDALWLRVAKRGQVTRRPATSSRAPASLGRSSA